MATRKCLSANFQPGTDPGVALRGLLDGVAEFAEGAGLAVDESQRLAIVVEEIASNTARHAVGDRPLLLELALADEGAGIAIAFEDDGEPFDPTARTGFDGPDPVTGGGVGLELVRAWCEMAYDRQVTGNRLVLRLPRRNSP